MSDVGQREDGCCGRGRLARYLACVLILLAVVSGFAYVYAFGVNVLWRDEWGVLPPLFDAQDKGTLSFGSFWKLQNEHRVVFPKLVILGLGLLSRGNTLVNLYFIECMFALILAIYGMVFWKQHAHNKALWLMVPTAFLVFSLRQRENMLWGYQISFVMVAVMALGVFLCLSRIKSGRCILGFTGAAGMATVAAYSSIHGLLVWPVGLGQLLIAPLEKRAKTILTLLWMLLGAGEWLLYFQHYAKPSHHPTVGFSLRYFPAIVGGSLWDAKAMASRLGCVILILVAAAIALVFVKRQWSRQSFWLATMAFSLATLGVITFGRSGFGLGQAMSSRYATFSIPLVIAAYGLLASLSRDSSSIESRNAHAGMPKTKSLRLMWSNIRAPSVNQMSPILLCATLGIALVGAGHSFREGLREGRIEKDRRESQQPVICAIESQPDDAIGVFGNKAVVRRNAAILKRLGYSVFADSERYCRPPSIASATTGPVQATTR